MKIFDIHIHIYPEKIAKRASESISNFYFGAPVRGDGTLEECLAKMDEAGIQRFAAHSVATTPHSVDSINEFILAAARKVPERIVPFAAIHPDMPDMDAAMDKIVHQGFRGLKIHPDMQQYTLDGERAMPMLRAIAESGLPLLIHCGDSRYDFDGPHRILSLHEKLPELNMICAHFGGWMEWESAAAQLPGHGLTVDLSSSLFHWQPEQAAEVIHRFGAKNVLYGSDYPMWNPAEELARFMKLPLTDAEREDILWNNAARLLQLA